MTFHCWVLRRWVFRGWVLRRWVFEAYCREYPTRNLELGISDVGHSRRWVLQMLGIPYENQIHGIQCLYFRKLILHLGAFEVHLECLGVVYYSLDPIWVKVRLSTPPTDL